MATLHALHTKEFDEPCVAVVVPVANLANPECDEEATLTFAIFD